MYSIKFTCNPSNYAVTPAKSLVSQTNPAQYDYVTTTAAQTIYVAKVKTATTTKIITKHKQSKHNESKYPCNQCN